MFHAALIALEHIGHWQVLLALTSGVLIGLFNGAMPGGAVPTLVVLLSLAYGMDPYIALPLAIGMVATVPTGDTLPAILLGVPGSTSGQATILDGHPMAQQGKAGVALSAAYFSSLIGGVFGAICLFIAIPIARPIVNTFGSAEFFILGLVAIAVVGVVSSGALLRGLMVGVFGLLIAFVGYDTITGTARLTMGTDYLWDGISIIPIVIGLFALPEFLDMIVSDLPIARDAGGELMKQATSGRREGMREVLHNWPLVLRSSVLGVFVGVLPGIGGSLAQWLAYASARQTVSGGTRTFGTGDVRGVIGPESANNAVDGGQLVPTLFFGVPGSVGMAIFLGFLIVLGYQPGPSMLNEHLDLTLAIVFSLVLSNVMATGLILYFSPILAKIAFVKPNVLVPIVLSILTIASFQANYSIWDLVVMLFFGGLGFLMKTYGWPRPPIIISVVLGSIIEKYYGIASRAYGWHMFSRIPVIVIILVAVGTGAYTVWMQRSVSRNKRTQDAELAALNLEATPPPPSGGADEPGPAVVRPKATLADRFRPTVSGVFLAVLTAFFAVFLEQSYGWPKEAAKLPKLISMIGLGLVAVYVIVHLVRPPATGPKARILDIGRTETNLSKKMLWLRTTKAIGSTVGLVVLIWLLGFHVAVPLYVFLYLIIFGKIRWWWAVLGAALFVGILYGFFDHVLAIRWTNPVLGSFMPQILLGP